MSNRLVCTICLDPDCKGHYQASPGPSALTQAIENKLRGAGTPDADEAIMRDLLWKFTRGDWHGVSDAANDLRVEEAKRDHLR